MELSGDGVLVLLIEEDVFGAEDPGLLSLVDVDSFLESPFDDGKALCDVIGLLSLNDSCFLWKMSEKKCQPYKYME